MKKPQHPGRIELGEHVWELPPFPDNIQDILFINEPEDNQYWRRQTDFPEEFFGYGPHTKINADFTQWEEIEGVRTIITLSKAATIEVKKMRDRELHRRRNGVWFMNKGKPTYLTGGHYFALQWCPIMGADNVHDSGSKYGAYREYQAHFFYFIELCRQNRKCTGGFIVKPKKTGITLMLAYDFLNYATDNADKNVGFMSMDHKKCITTCLSFFKYGLYNLPYIFLPEMSNDNKGDIIFNRATKKNTGTKNSQLRQMGNGKGLNTTVIAAPTAEKAFDGPQMHLINLDEFPKYKDPNPSKVWDSTKETVKEGGLLKGKIFITSYTPEHDNDSFKEGRAIYYDSKLDTVDEITGKTKTGLFVYAISALDSFQEDGVAEFDKYGHIDKSKVLWVIDSARDKIKKDRNALQALIREYPKTEEEAWRQGGGGGSMFDNMRLGQRLTVVEDALRHSAHTFREGNLQWVGEPYKYDPITGISTASQVRFIPLSEDDRINNKHASFRIYREKELVHPLITDGGLNSIVINNTRDEYGRFTPKANAPFVAASDPTEYTLKSDVMVGSKNAMTVFNFPDVAQNTFHGKDCTGRMVCRYLHRPENPEDYLSDLIKMVFYFGCYVIIEANKRWVITRFKLMGLQNFLLVIDKNRAIVPYNELDHQTLPDTSKTAIEDYCRNFEVYISEVPVGQTSGLDKIDDEVFIEQAMQFKAENPGDTKKFDLFVATAYNIMAMNSFMSYRIKLAQEENNYRPEAFSFIASKLLT